MEGRVTTHSSERSFGFANLVSAALLACALLFNAICLAPELRIARQPLNDLAFHLAASERLGGALESGEPFLDPWVSEWSLGYPLWRSYQPLPHLLAAAVLRATEPLASHAAAFAALHYLLLVLFPLSVYAGTRLLGFDRPAAGLAALLVSAPNGSGDLGRYGLGYGATVWRGSGLYTQLVALHLLVLSLGLTARALDEGRGRSAASLFLAVTSLSHIVFGYVAFVSAGLLALVGPRGEQGRRLARLGAIVLSALALSAWFVVPLFLARSEVNHSRWENSFKWDSHGARFILTELFSGRLLDAERLPILSVLVAVGAGVAALSSREALPRRLLVLFVFWLVVFFGRETWGHLLLLLGVPGDFHLHRLQAPFELSAVLVAAWGLERVVRAAGGVSRVFGFGLAACAGVLLILLGIDRAGYLRTNATWGEENLAAFEREWADLEAALADVREILAERPGRVSAGLAASWGRDFKIGSVPVFAFLTREQLDQASFLFHAMSSTSDLMVVRNENDAAHDVVFGVRAVVAPVKGRMPRHLRLRASRGRFAVYESSPEGYFGLVDIGARYIGPHSTAFDPSAEWLKSRHLRMGVVAALDGDIGGVPDFGRWQPLPEPAPALLTHRGRILSETKVGETYRARLLVERPCHALVKITFHPDLAATVDGMPAAVLRVTPGFAAVPISAGEHEVVVTYEPGPLKPALLVAGVLLFVFLGYVWRAPSFAAIEKRIANGLSRTGVHLGTERAKTAFALAVLSLLALRPLFRGRLIDGHDALAYPPRLVEMERALGDRHVPPIWAPDLGGGYGQPLFEFAPPLLYVASLPLRAVGLGLADSIQIGLALLFAAGAVAVYRLGRRAPASRLASLGGSAAWLLAPYLALDLYVRAAFAEAAALAVAPVALLGFLRALERPSGRRIALAGAAIALLPLAHNGAALLLLPAFVLVALVRGVTARPRLAPVLTGMATIVCGLALSAFAWLPALLEKEFVKTDLLRKDFLQWGEHAISALQLLWSPWGYGLSLPGIGDGMSFALGGVHVLLAGAGLAIALRSADPERRSRAVAFAAVATAGAWLATDWSSFVWSRWEALQYLAYPWRALLLPALFLPLLATHAFERLAPSARIGALAVLVLLNLPHTEPKRYVTFDDEYYSPDSIARKGINTTTREEYEPRWVETRPPHTNQTLVSRDGPIEVHEVSIRTARRRLIVKAAVDTEVEASTFYYPGWTVTIDGRETPVTPVARRGTMSFRLAAGEHRVDLELRSTPVRRVASFISLAAASALVLLAARPMRH